MCAKGVAVPTHIEQELGLGPIMHRFRRWVLAKTRPEDQLSLDPLTVNYAAWDEMRHNVRSWPHYTEAPNSIEVLVSPEDWEDYWGIDASRKEAGVSAYVRARAASKGFWIAGDPQVMVLPDDGLGIGEVEVVCQFVEPPEGEEASPIGNTSANVTTVFEERLPSSFSETTNLRAEGREEGARGEKDAGLGGDSGHKGDGGRGGDVGHKGDAGRGGDAGHKCDAGRREEQESDEGAELTSTVRFVDAETAGEVCLVGKGGFRLVIHSGDCIGAVSPGEEIPPEVNVRLDAEGFPYVDAKQCTIAVVGGRWTVTNHASHGTRLVTREGARLMLGEAEPYPIAEGDTLYLGPQRPLRFEMP